MKAIHFSKCIATGIAAALLVVSAQTSIAADNCAELLTNKCSDCHNLNRVCQKLGKKNKKRWDRTLKRMVKRGTKLTKSEYADILTCLVDQSPGAVQVCK